MKNLLTILICCLLVSCIADQTKRVDERASNIIPWDTLGYTVEGVKIKNTDTKVAGKPQNDSVFEFDAKKALNVNGFEGFLNRFKITFFARVDTSGNLSDINIINNSNKDSLTDYTIRKIMLPVIKKSEPWDAPIDYNRHYIS